MTNPKFKAKNYYKNKAVYNYVTENGKFIAWILIALNKVYPKVFYTKVLQEWLENYPDICKKMNEYEAAGVYDIKMQELCDEYGVNHKWCLAFAKRNTFIKEPDVLKVLANNVKLALVYTCQQYGIGQKRLAAIQAELDKKQPSEPERELDDRFKITLERQSVGEIDYRDIMPKKQKEASYQDIKRGYRGLAAFKALQDEVMGNEKG